ncbi:MAG: conjugative transposon protein TraN, partial [Chitinophagaceae bacterium]
MKNILANLALVLVFVFVSSVSWAQGKAAGARTVILEPYVLHITGNKTTNLIFPYAIRSVDRGSPDVLAQKAKGVENILLVKAGRENFPQTNLSVITTDGKLYSFLLNYSENPSLVNLSFLKDTAAAQEMLATIPEESEATIQDVAEKIKGKKRVLKGVKATRAGIKFQLNGLYIKGDVFYFQVELQNRSHIPYDIDMLRFFIKDEKLHKRTVSQEIELQSLYVLGDTSVIKEQSKSMLVIALPKFTIPDKKYLHVQLMEKGGGRALSV